MSQVVAPPHYWTAHELLRKLLTDPETLSTWYGGHLTLDARAVPISAMEKALLDSLVGPTEAFRPDGEPS